MWFDSDYKLAYLYLVPKIAPFKSKWSKTLVFDLCIARAELFSVCQIYVIRGDRYSQSNGTDFTLKADYHVRIVVAMQTLCCKFNSPICQYGPQIGV